MSAPVRTQGTSPFTPVTDASAAALAEQARAAQLAGDWADALAGFAAALAAAADDEHELRTTVLQSCAALHFHQGDRSTAKELFREAFDVARRHGLRRTEAQALNGLANVERFQGHHAVAEGLYQRARQIALEVGDQHQAAKVDQNLGVLANIRGDYATAMVCYQSALQRYRSFGDEGAASLALNNLGMLHVDCGELHAAEQCFQQALALATGVSNLIVVATVENNRAEMFLKRGRFEDARLCCDRSLTLSTRLQAKLPQAESYRLLAEIYRRTQRTRLAEIHVRLAHNLADACQDMLLRAEVLREWAQIHLAERRHREAVKLFNQSQRLFKILGARPAVNEITRDLERLHEEHVEALTIWASEAIESKNPYTAGHSSRVAEYACRLAAALGFSEGDLARVRVGALVHDVGKTVIPADVLNKPGRLDPDEWALMRQHPVIGEEIVNGLEFPYDVAAMVRGHHEHFDGSGYPDGLRGAEIDLTARILCVADIYDALTSTRSYRGAFAHGDALEIMSAESGKTVDPELFEVFVRVMGAAA